MLVRPNTDVAPDNGTDEDFAQSRRVVRVAANCGIQFIDVEIPVGSLDRTLEIFVEDTIHDEDGPRKALLVVPAENRVGDTVLHPINFAPVLPERILTLSGRDALEPYLDQWLPMTLFRQRATRPGEPAAFDAGPTSWARLFITRPIEGLAAAARLSAVLALDTRLADGVRAEEAPYLAPAREDAEHEAVFALDKDVQSLASFLAEPWLDRWLKQAAASDGRDRRATSFEHGHIACYLTLLQVLARYVPRVRILDLRNGRHAQAASGVDLVLDIGNGQTAALLIERGGGTTFTVLEDAVTLKVRDLDLPSLRHDGPIATRVEFAPAPFGPATLARLGGDSGAFNWPSLVRIGEEACRLANRPGAILGVTGMSSLKTRLAETEASSTLWRFSRERGSGGQTGPIVAGELLQHLTEDGDLAGTSPHKLPAIRPRFSASSAMTLFLGELMLHALAQINEPRPPTVVAPQIRLKELRRIVVSCAASMPETERALLLERASNAVDLVWRGMGWLDDASAPPKPRVVAGFDADLATQLIFLFEELRSRFGGNIRDFVTLVRCERAGRALRPSLRIASVDLGHSFSNLAIVDYNVAVDGSIDAALVGAERHEVAGDGLIDAICRAFIMPALALRLRQNGASATAAWISEHAIAGPSQPGEAARDVSRGGALLVAALESKVLRPAATALQRFYLEQAPAEAAGLYTFKLGALVERGNGRLDQVAADLNARVAAERGTPLDLAQVSIDLRWRDLSRTISATVRPLAEWLAGVVTPRECDLLLLSGPMASLPEMNSELERLMPLMPGRLISMRELDNSLLSMPGGADAYLDPTWLAGAIGAYLASRNALGAESFNLDTSRLAVAGSAARPMLGADAAGVANAAAEDVEKASG